MNWEIEIKAHISEPQQIEQKILQMGGQLIRSYHKVDQYFHMDVAPGETQDFRLRVDGDKALVTFKDKKLKDGLEMNREGEFSVSDPELFEAFMIRLGAHRFIEKRKRGKAFKYKELLLELSEVRDLGWFLEIEAVFHKDYETHNPKFIQATEQKLFRVLSSLGISKDAIEPRTYTQMLREQGIR
jgi:adenylate cyclase class 2